MIVKIDKDTILVYLGYHLLNMFEATYVYKNVHTYVRAYISIKFLALIFVHWPFYITEGTQVPFLERETSYPEGSTFRIDDDISQTLRPLKCKRNVSIVV